MTALDDVNALIASRLAIGDDDPESGHADMDAMTERVVRAVATGEPDAVEAAVAVQVMLDTEDREKWRRWYA